MSHYLFLLIAFAYGVFSLSPWLPLAGAALVLAHMGASTLWTYSTALLNLTTIEGAIAEACEKSGVTLLVGQAYVLLRLGVKLGFYASHVAFFQAALAHADYVAAPLPEWPESPAVEAVRGGPGAGPTPAS